MRLWPMTERRSRAHAPRARREPGGRGPGPLSRRYATIATSRAARAWRAARFYAAYGEGILGAVTDIANAVTVAALATFLVAVLTICYDLMWMSHLSSLPGQADCLQGLFMGIFATRVWYLRDAREARVEDLADEIDYALGGEWPDDWHMDS